MKSPDGNIVAKHQIPNWNGQENNGRSSTDLERQGNEQRLESETSTLAGVYISHLGL